MIAINRDELFQALNADSESWNIKLVIELFSLAQEQNKLFCMDMLSLGLDVLEENIVIAVNILGYDYDENDEQFHKL